MTVLSTFKSDLTSATGAVLEDGLGITLVISGREKLFQFESIESKRDACVALSSLQVPVYVARNIRRFVLWLYGLGIIAILAIAAI